ncbi:MAG: universal stress protein [Anaerolineales bacterium]|nr:universal stress protein [Anaerolineales bacterium]
MSTVNSYANQCLALGELRADLRLLKKLPREVAFRYHVLPVAEDMGRITVAMADPDDATAQAAVVDALGAAPYIVKGDTATIDATLTQLWSDESPQTTSLLVYAGKDLDDDTCSTYARYLGQLLGAEVTYSEPAGSLDALTNKIAKEGHELVICGEFFPSLIRRLIYCPQDSRLARMSPTSLLLVRGSRRSLEKILWVVRPESKETNETAFSWITRLARHTLAQVVILVVVPPVPAMYCSSRQMQPGLASLLSSNTALGTKLGTLARRLSDEGIEAALKLRQGPPETQLRLEVDSTDPDLIVISGEPETSWKRWITGEQINPLLRWADRPVLIAKPSP